MTNSRLSSHRFAACLFATPLAAALVASIGCTPGTGSTLPMPIARTISPTATADARFVSDAERSAHFAIRMADLLIAAGARDSIKSAAQSIKDREASNLTLLAKERSQLGLPPSPSTHDSDPHLSLDTERLAALKGEDADRFYVEHMIDQRRTMFDTTLAAQRDLQVGSLAVFARGLPGDLDRDLASLKGVQHAAQLMPANSRGNKGTKGGLAPTKIKPK